MNFKHNLVRTPITGEFDVNTLTYPKDRFELISVDYVDEWDQLQKHTKGDGSVTTYVHKGKSITVTLRCKRCGEVKQVVDKPTISCKNGPCNVAWKDLTGKKFGKLTAISYEYGSYRKGARKRWYWKCKCDCGEECYKTEHDLIIAGQQECRTCARKHNLEAITLPDNAAKWNREYRVAKKNAAARNYSFELTLEEFRHLCESRCNYCGEEPHEHSSGLIKNGVDRLDNTMGYTLENSVPCCPMCNTMKLHYSLEEWLQKMEQILKYCKERSTTISQESTPKQVETDSPEKEDIV